MKIDIFSATGQKGSSMDLPASLFEATINEGLMHQALMLQQSNRRTSTAHTKNRSEVNGSTRKLFAQKGTGRARRGSVRAPLLRGGGKAFGSRKEANFEKSMPKNMRRAALRSGLSFQAKNGAILGLENFGDVIKTKTVADLLKKLPCDEGRSVLFVTPGTHKSLIMSARNIPHVKTVSAAYLNIEDILHAKSIVFMVDAITQAEELFGEKGEVATAKKTTKKPKKASTKTASDSSDSSES